MTHAIPNASRPRFDGGRIAASAGAIALNAAMLMLLLVPLAVPPSVDMPEREPTFTWVPRVKPQPVPPIPVPVVKPRPTPRTAVMEPTRIELPPRPEVIDPLGEIAVPPLDETAVETFTDEGDAAVDPFREPQTGAHLQYASAPPPRYPREAMRDRLTGTVLLRVLVDVDGTPLEVTVQRSSGHRTLDQAARTQVLGRWKFVPAMHNGQAVRAIGLVPIEFSLQR